MPETATSPAAINLDIAAPADWPAPEEALRHTVREAIATALRVAPPPAGPCEVNVVLADARAIRALNRHWRGKDAPTNVLSFPAPAHMPLPPGAPRPLGDIILAGPVVAEQAAEAGVSLTEQLAWLTVHGLLHLLGYDHVDEDQARIMEDTERRILARLGLSDPYGDESGRQ